MVNIKRVLKREVRDWQEEIFRFTSDVIRVYNKHVRKSNSLDVWVVLK